MFYGVRKIMHNRTGYLITIPSVWVKSNKLEIRRKITLDVVDDAIVIRPAYAEEGQNEAS